MHRRLRMSAILAVCAALICTGAGTALAAPDADTMGVDAIQQRIDAAGGSLPARMLTVMKGSTVSTLTVDLLCVTGGFTDGPEDMSSLIMFESSDPAITKIGGIAAGMSGSPIYVDDNGDGDYDTLVGALSYGDWDTYDGIGLATPVLAMQKIKDYPAPNLGVRPLPTAIMTGSGVKTSVIISPDPATAAKTAGDSVVVATPLSARYLGGVNPSSPMYKAFAAHLAKRGTTLVSKAGGLSSRESTYAGPFEPGSAVAALAARGDLWYGGIGTVTFIDGSEVYAFGHPLFWSGLSGNYLNYAWIDEIWRGVSPYKLGRPATVAGTLTQDRFAGIMGDTAAMPEESTITASASFTQHGATTQTRESTSAVMMPKHAINSPSWDYEGVAAFGAYIAGARVVDSWSASGSAFTTTTVTVTDGTDVYTVKRSNVVDSDYDIASSVIEDAWDITSSLASLNANGIAKADILSVDVESSITDERNICEIVNVNTAGPLHSGDNTITISYLRHGEADTQTVDSVLTIPSNVPLTGRLYVGETESESFSPEEMFAYLEGIYIESGSSYIDRTTVAKRVEELNDYMPNDTFTIGFQPEVMVSELELGPESGKLPSYQAIETTEQIAGTVVLGWASKISPRIALLPDAATIPYADYTWIDGELLGASDETTLTVRRKLVCDTTSKSLKSIAIDDPSDDAAFYIMDGPLARTAAYTVSFPGDSNTLPTAATVKVKVAAAVSLSASSYSIRKGSTSTMKVAVKSTKASGKVYFEKWNPYYEMWVSAGAGSVKAYAAGALYVTYKVKPRSTTKYRARFMASSTSANASKNSRTITVKVR